MSPEQWKRALEILELIEDDEPQRRDQIITAECDGDTTLEEGLRELLTEKAAIGQGGGAGHSDFLQPLRPGEIVGPYRVLKLLGSGGMGEVFLALRTDDERLRVDAVKVLPAGQLTTDRLTRAVREGETLRRLQGEYFPEYRDHGQLPDKRPYLAMEFIDGLPIDEYCVSNDLNLEERLRLFKKVCEAVSSAHSALVLHRDLKPSNILVTSEGIPKVLDFGIAKALAPDGSASRTLTAVSAVHFSANYASPEQIAEAALTTTSDVYSLGVVLYELLTGVVPYELSPLMPNREQILERLNLGRIDAPSSVVSAEGPAGLSRKDIRGDLDTIVSKMLRSEASERYHSVEQLVDDVDRYLEDRPILARRRDYRYRFRKFVMRNKIAFGVAAAFLVTVVIALGAFFSQYQETVRERDRNERVTDFIVEVFSAAAPERTLGEDLTVVELVEEAGRRLEWQLSDEPLDRAQFLETLGRLYTELGAYESGDPLLREALEIRSSMLRPEHDDVASTHLNLGWLLLRSGKYESAEIQIRKALAIYERSHADSGRVAESLIKLATVLELRKELDEALETAGRASAIYEATSGLESDEYASALNLIATIHQARGDFASAEPLFRKALQITHAVYGSRHPEVASRTGNLGLLLHEMGNFAEAEGFLERAVALSSDIYGLDHIGTLTQLSNLALLHAETGEVDQAEDAMKEVLSLMEGSLGVDHPYYAQCLHSLGYFYDKNGRLEEAEPIFVKAIEAKKRALGPRHPSVATSLNSLAIILKNTGRFQEARPLYEEALEIYREAYGEDHPNYAAVLHNTSRAFRDQGEYSQARTLAEQSLRILANTIGPENRHNASVLQNLGKIALLEGDFEEAEAHYLRALEIKESVFGTTHKNLGGILLSLEELMSAWGRADEAQVFSERVAEIMSEPES